MVKKDEWITYGIVGGVLLALGYMYITSQKAGAPIKKEGGCGCGMDMPAQAQEVQQPAATDTSMPSSDSFVGTPMT